MTVSCLSVKISLTIKSAFILYPLSSEHKIAFISTLKSVNNDQPVFHMYYILQSYTIQTTGTTFINMD